MRKGILPGQRPVQTQANDERGQVTAEIEVVTSVDFTAQTITTRKLKMINGRLARAEAASDPAAAGAVPVPTVPTTGLPIYFAKDTGGDDTYTSRLYTDAAMTREANVTSLTTGLMVLLHVATAATNACTFAPITPAGASLGAKNIQAYDFGSGAYTDPGTNKIGANDVILLVYEANNDHWRLQTMYRA